MSQGPISSSYKTITRWQEYFQGRSTVSWTVRGTYEMWHALRKRGFMRTIELRNFPGGQGQCFRELASLKPNPEALFGVEDMP